MSKPCAMLAVLVLLAAGAAHAEDKPVPLKDAPGREVVENNCAACHSLDYIRMNAPFPTPKVWEAEVNKMIKAFGASIDPPDAQKIIDYLATNYGTPG